MGEYYELHEELKRLGFREDLEVICRWRLGELRVDVMSTEEMGLGTSNTWYPKAAAEANRIQLPSGAAIRLVSPPLFVARSGNTSWVNSMLFWGTRSSLVL